MESGLSHPRTSGRPRGGLCSFRCHICSTVEQVRGGTLYFRCSACKAAGLWTHKTKGQWTGKEQAGTAVALAVKEGRLPRVTTLSCVDCGKPAQQYEHRDYNKPLSVDPTCRRCNLKRGPALPLHGAVERMLERGSFPYRQRARGAQLCVLMGRPDVAATLPDRTLRLEDWRRIWPMLIGSNGARSPASEATHG